MDNKECSTLEWEKFNDLILTYLGLNFNSIDELVNNIEINNSKINWLPLKEWESLDDVEIYRHLEELEKPEGEVYVISEITYLKQDGPFKLNATYLKKFITQYLDRFHECFFNGDALIFSIEHKQIWIFHHEGIYALVKLK
jgi:hypothetical protein